MFNYLKNNLKEILFSKKFIDAILLSIICLFIGIIEYIVNWDFEDIGVSYLFNASYSFGFFSILIFIAPIISAMPYSLSYFEHDKNNDDISKNKKFIMKLFTNFIVGGLVLSISIIIYIIIIILLFGINRNDINLININYVLKENQYLYLLNEIIFSFIFGATFANITMCLYIILKNKYLSILTSVFFNIFTVAVLDKISIYLNSQIIYSFCIYPQIGYVPRIVYFIVINTIFVSLSLYYNNTNNNINYKKIYKYFIYFSVGMLIFFKVNRFINIYGYKSNFLEFLIEFFNDLYTIPYFISFCVLMMIYKFFSVESIKEYSIKDIMLLVLYKIIILYIFIFFISFILSIGKMNFKFNWSNSFFNINENIKSIYKLYTPLTILIISLINSFYYLFIISVVCIITFRISLNDTFSTIVTTFLIIFGIASYIGRIEFLKMLSPVNYSLTIVHSLERSIPSIIFISIIYWIIMSVIISYIYLNFKLNKGSDKNEEYN